MENGNKKVHYVSNYLFFIAYRNWQRENVQQKICEKVKKKMNKIIGGKNHDNN